MNAYQNAKHNCFKLTVFEAKQHQETVSQVPVFEAAVNRLDIISNELDELKVLQEQDITGVTVDKEHIKDELVPLLGDLANAVQVHALKTKKQTLFEKVNYSENVLDLLPKDKLNTVAAIIIGEAEKLPAENMSEMGISVDDLVGIKEKHSSYKQLLRAPRQASIERSNYTERISKLIDEGWDIMKNTLDKLIGQFRRKDPDFFLKYQAASHIAYTRRRHNGNNTEDIKDEDNEAKE